MDTTSSWILVQDGGQVQSAPLVQAAGEQQSNAGLAPVHSQIYSFARRLPTAFQRSRTAVRSSLDHHSHGVLAQHVPRLSCGRLRGDADAADGGDVAVLRPRDLIRHDRYHQWQVPCSRC
ncbi:unnamed protein product [Phytophthora lilii]|uniref:Unnamed protein product n=1 Tax=Phytophthora lilii TaxID=2077276 RepID=A0A9W6XN73_9STRA|nr:unnamed protein product [Phytophthora lilii]